MMNNNTPNTGAYYIPPAQGAPQSPQGTPYQPLIAPQKTYKPFAKKDGIFLLLTLALSLMFVDFVLFHGKGFGLGITVTFIALFAVSTAYLWKRSVKKSFFSLACGVLSLAGALTFTLFDNLLINGIMLVLVCGLYAVYVLGISGTFTKPQGSFKMLFDLFGCVLVQPFTGLDKVKGAAKATSKNNKKITQSLLGIAIAIPFVAVIVPLLASGDAAFEGLVKQVLTNFGIYALEVVLALIGTPFLFSFLFSKRDAGTPQSSGGTNTRVLTGAAAISFLSVISVTYVIYLFSQLAYFFSAFKGILPEGYQYTASAFARRGFYEMFVICVINIVIIAGIGILTKRTTRGAVRAVKGLSVFISLFSVLLIATAMQKMKLNISIYGLSVNRVLVSVLMLMLLVMIAFFILHIFAPKVPYMQSIILICSVLFIALSFANPDALCTRYNINAYQSGKIEMLDVKAIRQSSDSAVPYLVQLTGEKDDAIANQAKNQIAVLVKNHAHFDFDKSREHITADNALSDFRSYNMARSEAYTALKGFYDKLSDEEKLSMLMLLQMYDDYDYDAEEDCFTGDSGNDEIKHYYYNPKTGLYDKVTTEKY